MDVGLGDGDDDEEDDHDDDDDDEGPDVCTGCGKRPGSEDVWSPVWNYEVDESWVLGEREPFGWHNGVYTGTGLNPAFMPPDESDEEEEEEDDDDIDMGVE